MNEAETRAELIDPALREAGWGVIEGSRIHREYQITDGKIQSGGGRAKKWRTDYVLAHRGVLLAVVEAKSSQQTVGEGVMQAKRDANKLRLDHTFSTNGKEIYQICLRTAQEGTVSRFPTPDELWAMTFGTPQTDGERAGEVWRERFLAVPFEDKGGSWQLRYYQTLAINRALEAVAEGRQRILLTLATGTGKTAIAFQIAWKLFQTRWTLARDGARRPRILFLADRNILANQAFTAFSTFPDDALVRIKPADIRRRGAVPTNGSVFFTIFQTFMSAAPESGESDGEVSGGGDFQFNFGQYPPDFFDLIIIDECHRGGANDESTWRGILEYFAPAVQLGLTATPKRQDNADTYAYFGEPAFTYSLREGIEDGFLTPFKVRRIQTTLDDYIYTDADRVLEGEVEYGKLYEERDFNRKIEIQERERKRVEIFLNDCNPREKSLIFCADQAHAALVRDWVNQLSPVRNPFYCVRVTANDGEEGERQLREFQDNEKSIPTILTTSQKLSTGVDARNVRNIVLLRPVNSMVEFKQIVGRGTRVFDGKDFFTIYDFVGAYRRFNDPDWDGPPLPCKRCGQSPCVCAVAEPPTKVCNVCGNSPCTCPKTPCEKCGQSPCVCPKKVKIELARGKAREIQHTASTLFWSAEGKPISAETFIENLFGELPNFFKDERELREIWSQPATRKVLLEKLEAAGFPKTDLLALQKLVDMERSDLFDVLEYVFNGDHDAPTRAERSEQARRAVLTLFNDREREFIDFVLQKYVEAGVDELEQGRLDVLLKNKYQSLADARSQLGEVGGIVRLFVDFQRFLYETRAA